MTLTGEQQDAVTELVNIAFARTGAALSELTGSRVELTVPEVSAHPIGERNRPRVACCVRVALRAIGKAVRGLKNANHPVRDEPPLCVRILKSDDVANPYRGTGNRTIERDRADAERRHHRARVHLNRLESSQQKHRVRKHADDGHARKERYRRPRDRPEGKHD